MNKLPVLQDTKVGIPTSVYKYYDKSGLLIYVGITSGGILRQRQHNDSKEWWSLVVRQEVEHFKSRELAHSREIQLIDQFRPPFNKQHNPDHAVVHKFYMDMVAGDPVANQEILARIQTDRTVVLHLRDRDDRKCEVEFHTPLGDLLVAECLWFNHVQPPPVLVGNNLCIGRVISILNRQSYASVRVRIKHGSLVGLPDGDAVGTMKVVHVFKAQRLGFKRIQWGSR